MARTPYKVKGKERQQLRRAWKAARETYDKWFESGDYDVSPIARTFEEELESITTKREFNRRLRELKAVKAKDAGKPVKFHGIVMPKYMRTQIRYVAKMVNSDIKERRSADYYNLDELSMPKQLAAIANKDLDYIFEEDYVDSPESFNELLEIEYPNVPKKAEAYISVWEDMGGAEDIPEIIRFLAQHDPDGFYDLMHDPFNEEAEIEYIYPIAQTAFKGKKSGHTYDRESAYKTEHSLRMGRAEDFWRLQYWEYQNAEGYWRTGKGR